jgi:hypothetical protein
MASNTIEKGRATFIFRHRGFLAICREGDDPEIFRGVRDKWLVDGEASPFNAMHKLLQYGMRVGLAIGGRERVLWSKDGETMYFDGRP